MFSKEDRVSRTNIFQKNRKSSFVRIILFIVFASLMIPVTTVSANEGLETIYHVYVDGEHIGEVNDKAIVQQIIDKKIAAEQSTYEGINLTIGEDISIIPELVFNPTHHNDAVTARLENRLTVMANVVALKIDEDVVGYFNNQQVVEEVLMNYMAKYVDAKELGKVDMAKFEAHDIHEEILLDKQNKKTTLKNGESIIVDIDFSKHVSFSKQKAAPSEILTAKQGVKLLEKGTLAEKVHIVKSGEVLGTIASKYDLTTKKILALNPSLSEDSLLQIGQEINVTEFKPFVEVVVKAEEKKKEKIAYKTEIIESDELYKGEEKIKQAGKDGRKEVHYAVVMKNGVVAKKDILHENIKSEAVNKIIVKGTKVIPSRGTGTLSWPAVGGYISSYMGERWGRMHKGIDIARPSNRSILAADNGVVVSAGYEGGYGNKIVIDHNNGMRTIYAHLSSIGVRTGQVVEKGSTIGVMGTTGHSTGVHLHFEVYVNGVLKNPLSYLNR